METLHQTTSSGGAGTPAVPDFPRVIEGLLRRLGASAVFGEPIRSGETTVIPVAEVRVGFGFGSGVGPAENHVQPGGGGGGGGGKVIPRGYIRVTPAGARFEPVVNVTAIALGSMALAAVGIIAFSRIRR